MMVSDYSVERASEETRQAMADRCHSQGHEFVNCCTAFFQIYQKCRWCGESQ